MYGWMDGGVRRDESILKTLQAVLSNLGGVKGSRVGSRLLVTPDITGVKKFSTLQTPT